MKAKNITASLVLIASIATTACFAGAPSVPNGAKTPQSQMAVQNKQTTTDNNQPSLDLLFQKFRRAEQDYNEKIPAYNQLKQKRATLATSKPTPSDNDIKKLDNQIGEKKSELDKLLLIKLSYEVAFHRANTEALTAALHDCQSRPKK